MKEYRKPGLSDMPRDQVKRSDCKTCKFCPDCGDIFKEVGRCPANNGGEKWATYTPWAVK